MPAIWDISQPIRPGLPIWPGDTAFAAETTWSHGPGCPVHVSKITLSTHTGSHADAPLHYDPNGAGADALDLSPYLGPCRVIDARRSDGLVRPDDIAAFLDRTPPRILLRTYECFPVDNWASDFIAVAAETIDILASHGVVLIGIDSPSMDPETSKDLPTHNAIRRHGLAILEGLVLDHVAPGDYELIALPLPLVGLDASPVRAILRPLQS